MPTPDFAYRIERAARPDGRCLILLHGTGGDENDLIPLARRLAPDADLLGLRGRSLEEGAPRWFRRLSMARFDQDHIRAEAAALAGFLDRLLPAEAIAPEGVIWLGYSNGANFIGALMGLCPGLVRRAVLMRAMPVLDPMPQADLAGVAALTLTGSTDPYGRYGPALDAWLREAGADLDTRMIPAGHGLSQTDLDAAGDWLGRQAAR